MHGRKLDFALGVGILGLALCAASLLTDRAFEADEPSPLPQSHEARAELDACDREAREPDAQPLAITHRTCR
ncbi:MAG: hypothetical protein ABW321_30455 [Polyangiales bacterium]